MNNSLTDIATDMRQTPMWEAYMRSIGWHVENISGTYIFLNRLKYVHRSFAKIQHPKGPLDLHAIDKYFQSQRIDTAIIEPHLSGHQPEIFKDFRFKPTRMKFGSTATILIDLNQSSENLFNSFSENARRNIHKAQKLGIRTSIINFNSTNPFADFATFFALMTKVSKMRKFYIPSYNEMQKKYVAFGNNQFLAFAYSHQQSEPIAAVWYGYYDKTLAYLHTGITDLGYSNFANYLLVWEGLLEGQRRNLQVFDFEAIYDERYPRDLKRWAGFTQFKKRFHGQIIHYPQPYLKNYSLFGKIFFR
jgi:lipid II:glycine glycyltransferase (peptidoglycan interpeptide bridge formation enzyme)